MQFDDEIARRYPHIRFEKHWSLDEDSIYLLGSCDAIVNIMCQLPLQPEHRQRMLLVSLVKGAQATTAIEGNTLTDEEVQKVSSGASLPPSKQYQEREVRNILDAMNGLVNDLAGGGAIRLVSPELIREFHLAVGKELGEHFDAVPGQFRTDERFVGPYKCPRGQHVVPLVDRLCEWLKREFQFAASAQTFSQAVIQAIVTHVYIEWIHPFGDGNGRTGRLLEFYILLRSGNPDIASHILSNHYNDTRSEYYRQLDHASKTRDLTAFLRYAIQGYHDGLRAVLGAIRENGIQTAWVNLVYNRFAETPYHKRTVFKRRRRLALALPANVDLRPEQVLTLTPELAREYGGLSPRSLWRDLDELVRMKIVTTTGGAIRANYDLLTPHMARRRRVDGR